MTGYGWVNGKCSKVRRGLGDTTMYKLLSELADHKAKPCLTKHVLLSVMSSAVLRQELFYLRRQLKELCVLHYLVQTSQR